jgi:hypothetical protein
MEGFIVKFIGAVIAIVIGASLAPTVFGAVTTATNATTNTTNKALLPLIDLVYIAGIIVITAGLLISGGGEMKGAF